jgi:hypothetical protein
VGCCAGETISNWNFAVILEKWRNDPPPAVASGRLLISAICAALTHALVAGQIKGAAEPALVLTPPAVASEADDGLLTSSEIARTRKTPPVGGVLLAVIGESAS